MNLEANITDWRQRMQAAGIQSPVPLEELEEHLREEVERQVKLGMTEAEAFQSAICLVGQPGRLRAEFSRAGEGLGGRGHDRATQISRILGLAWMVDNVWDLRFYTSTLAEFLYFPLFSGMRITTANSGMMQGEMALDLAGIVAGFYLFRGTKLFRGIVWLLAGFQLLDSVPALAQIPPGAWRVVPLAGYLIFALEISFLLATLWLLRPRPKTTMSAR